MDRRRGREGGRGDHRPDPAPFPADDGTPTLPADDQHSRQWHAQNGQRGYGGAWPGKHNGHRPPDDRPGNHRLSPSDAAGRARDECVKWRAAAGSPAPWRTCQKADVQRDGGTRSPTGCWVWETTGPPSDADGWWRPAHLMSALTRLRTVIFLVSYIHCKSRLKRPFLHCRADSVASMVISSRRQKHLFPLPLPLIYATVLCFTASVCLECGPWLPWSNKRSDW